MMPILAALGAILLWSSLAALAVNLSHIPPFFLTGVALCIGGLIALPKVKHWRVTWPVLAAGVYGLFLYHFLLFIGLRYAPALQANLLNYLWPLLIVVMAPLFIPGQSLQVRHIIAVGLGLVGALLAMLGGRSLGEFAWHTGFIFALAAAFVWSSYSLILKRLPPVSVWANGGLCLICGALALGCHAVFEATPTLTNNQWGMLVLLGIGPMGAAFYLWDIAMKRGDARVIGTLAYATPVLSTLLLALTTRQPITLTLMLAVALVVVAGLMSVQRSGS